MTMWRCVNNAFGYCNAEPDWDCEPQERVVQDAVKGVVKVREYGGSCKRKPDACGRFATLTDKVASLKQESLGGDYG